MKKTKKIFLTAATIALLGMSANLGQAVGVPIIFDTDMCEDVDDVGALAILHALADAGEAEILGCMVSAPNEWVGPCIDAINTYYGRPDIPIGQLSGFIHGYPTDNGKPINTNYAQKVAENFPHDLQKSSDAPDAVSLYRKILASSPDHSVKVVTVGFLTNLKNLLNSTKDEYSNLNGEELVKQKVAEWVCMGACFPNDGYEYNVMRDTVASIRAVNDWPTPVVFSGAEIGSAIFSANALKSKPTTNPVRMGYEWYWGGNKENINRESWDLTTVLYAVRGCQDYWTLSEPGKCIMHGKHGYGMNEWIPCAKGNHRYLIKKMDTAQVGKVLDELMCRDPKLGEGKPPIATRENGFVELFDGTFNGWTLTKENPDSWSLEDGMLYAHGPRAHLFYTGDICNATFRDYVLHVEARAMKGANSGVFINTKYQENGWPSQGYEIQVNNSMPRNGNNYEHKKTGSIYSVRNVYKQVVPEEEWFDMDISVQGAHVIVWVNGMKVADYTEPKSAAKLVPGTIALQAHDPNSRTYYRRLAIKPLIAEEAVYAPEPSEKQKQFNALSASGFPLVDMHTHMKGGMVIQDFLDLTYNTGANFGVAANCGMKFPITDDAGALAYLQSMKGKPVFVGMQAEGREWVKMFSPEVISQFDFVLTDSMTFTDDDGHRLRLWIPEETVVGDPQKFMDMLVNRIEGIMKEPIDLYANSTYLPDVISKDYDTLWTEERMDRVIKAAKDNNVAIEINCTYNIPSATFIKRAKAAGVKFTFGTNNSDNVFGETHLDYALKMIKECDLKAHDMWVPGKFGNKRNQSH